MPQRVLGQFIGLVRDIVLRKQEENLKRPSHYPRGNYITSTRVKARGKS